MNLLSSPVKRKAVWGSRRIGVLLLLLVFGASFSAEAAGPHYRQVEKAKDGMRSDRVKDYKLDGELSERASRGNPIHTTSVIVTLVPGANVPPQFKKYMRGAKLDLINGQVLDVPNSVLKKLESHPGIFRIHHNREIKTHNYRTAVTVGARQVQNGLGYTGAGIGVAVIDSTSRLRATIALMSALPSPTVMP